MCNCNCIKNATFIFCPLCGIELPKSVIKTVSSTPIAWQIWGGGKSATYFGTEADDFIFNHKRSNTFAILRVYQTLEEAKKDPSW